MVENKSYGTVLIRAKGILDYLMEQQSGQTLKEISEGLEATKSTTLKILNTMCELNLLWRSESDKRYNLGPALIGYGQKAMSEFDVRDIALPFLTKLRDQTEETVHLGIESDQSIVFLAKLESPRSVSLKSRIGGNLNLYSSAMGKAIMAEMSNQELKAYYDTTALTALTQHTITSRAKLQAEIEKTRQRGYSIDDRENEEEVYCVGAVIKPKGRIFGAFSVSTPEYRIDAARKQEISQLVLATKQAIEAEF